MQVVSFSSKALRLRLPVLALLICTCLSSTVMAHAVSVTQTSVQVKQANWPLFGFDARNRRFNPSEHILSTSNVSSLTEAWSFPVHAPVDASQVVVNGVIYVASSSDTFYALNAVTGKQLWSFRGNPASPSWTPAVANGVVYFGDDYHVY